MLTKRLRMLLNVRERSVGRGQACNCCTSCPADCCLNEVCRVQIEGDAVTGAPMRIGWQSLPERRAVCIMFAGVDARAGADASAGADANTGADANNGVDANAGADADADTAASADAGADAGIDAGADDGQEIANALECEGAECWLCESQWRGRACNCYTGCQADCCLNAVRRVQIESNICDADPVPRHGEGRRDGSSFASFSLSGESRGGCGDGCC